MVLEKAALNSHENAYEKKENEKNHDLLPHTVLLETLFYKRPKVLLQHCATHAKLTDEEFNFLIHLAVSRLEKRANVPLHFIQESKHLEKVARDYICGLNSFPIMDYSVEINRSEPIQVILDKIEKNTISKQLKLAHLSKVILTARKLNRILRRHGNHRYFIAIDFDQFGYDTYSIITRLRQRDFTVETVSEGDPIVYTYDNTLYPGPAKSPKRMAQKNNAASANSSVLDKEIFTKTFLLHAMFFMLPYLLSNDQDGC
ncbi:unnamed protein product [Enterobius vermicularis]|uniref:SMC hinge domain-containing protein n=1 Tax=Enterobius vermicularis TaxID=51028 RepID=A0A0N4V0X8_ENTVE|nr:unnamed protein product [Enterobius vermicularis]